MLLFILCSCEEVGHQASPNGSNDLSYSQKPICKTYIGAVIPYPDNKNAVRKSLTELIAVEDGCLTPRTSGAAESFSIDALKDLRPM